MATKLAAKPKNADEDRLAQASIPVMPEPPLPEASVSTFSYSDSDDEDVDEVLLVDSPPPLPHPGGSRVHSSSPPLSAPLLEQSPPSCCNSNNGHSIPNSSMDDLHNSIDTPPPPPPLKQCRPQPGDNMVVPPTPESEPKTSRTYTDIVKHSSLGKNHHQQPQDHKLKSIIIDLARHEVPRHCARLRVHFTDSPSCSATSSIDSPKNTLWRKKKLKIASMLNQDWSGVNQATQLRWPLHHARNQGAGETNFIGPRRLPLVAPQSAISEVTIQDVEDALLQLEIVVAKEPPLNSISCCSPTHATGGESDPLLLSSASTNAEPSCPIIQLEKQTIGSSAQMLRLETIESTTPTLEIDASSSSLTSHQLEDTLAKVTLEGMTGFRLRRCRFRLGYVYTRCPRYESARPRRGFGAASGADPCMDIVGHGHTLPPLPEDDGHTTHEVVLANFIQSITKPIQQSLLCPQQHGLVKPRKEKNRPSKPSRRSARLATIAWQCGDAQIKARQVLMKRLGVTQEEGETMEMTLLCYLNLFKGPMFDFVIKVLVALSGLDGPAMLGQIAT
ncbi:unnamed protein product [Miscanthus lutarioriparius]|uniref:Uncharacterized protein n=1 Tax=Miscanthus lutarioriparius TaxID=422564 RepID=A0A811PQE3_9POAL|nr:unnamed protein product [Miscanthus lutarioriparius]